MSKLQNNEVGAVLIKLLQSENPQEKFLRVEIDAEKTAELVGTKPEKVDRTISNLHIISGMEDYRNPSRIWFTAQSSDGQTFVLVWLKPDQEVRKFENRPKNTANKEMFVVSSIKITDKPTNHALEIKRKKPEKF